MPCLGLHFLAECSEMHTTEHFLFNFETAVSSMAIVIALYALFIEKRFRIRVHIKMNTVKQIIGIVLLVIIFTLVGAILPFIPGTAIPLLGYPVFWEFVAALLFLIGIYLSFDLFKRIRKLTAKQASNLAELAPTATMKYHDSLELLLREADYFWEDFLKKTLTDDKLKNSLNSDFTEPDFLEIAAKSRYVLLQTVRIIKEEKERHDVEHIESFLRDLVMTSLILEGSVLSEDLKSSYKPIAQHMLRECELAPVIFGSFSYIDFLYKEKHRKLILFQNLIEVFELHLGRKYHRTEDDTDYMGLINSDVLECLFRFFHDCLSVFDSKEQTKLLDKLAHTHFLSLESLPEGLSIVLAEGIYGLLERYATRKDWSSDDDHDHDRSLCMSFSRTYVECNQHTKRAFDNKLLEKITGNNDEGESKEFTYNLIGYYPMMIPIYFFIYGYNLFETRIADEDIDFHLSILKMMQSNLPKIAEGHVQQYFKADLPKEEKDREKVQDRAKRVLSHMFPPNVIYNKDENSITYHYFHEENYKTILLNETVENNKVTFQTKP